MRSDIVLSPVRHADPASIAARGTAGPFQTASFDFALERAASAEPARGQVPVHA